MVDLRLGFQNTAGQAFILGTMKLLKAAISALVIVASASYFGFARERDFWVLSSSFVMTVSQLAFGPVYEIYRIRFASEVALRGVRPAFRSACGLNTAILSVCMMIIAAAVLLKEPVASIIAPGYRPSETAALSEMLMWVIPLIGLQQAIMSFNAMLNALEHYVVPEIAQISSVATTLMFILAGHEGLGINSLIAGTYAGQLLACGIMIGTLKRKSDFPFQLLCLPDQHAWQYFSHAAPFWLSFLAGQLLAYAEKAFSSYLPQGQVSLFDYGRKLVEMPMGLVMGVTYSLFSVKLASQFNSSGLTETVELGYRFVRYLLFATMPITVLFVCCTDPLYVLLFANADPQLVFLPKFSSMMMAFAVSLPALCLYSVTSQTLIVSGKGRLSANVSTFFILLIIAVDAVGFERLGIVWLSLCWSVGLCLSGTLQMYALQRSSGDSGWTQMAWLAVLVGPPLLVVYALSRWFPFTTIDRLGPAYCIILYILVFQAVSLLLMTAAIWAFALPEKKSLLRAMRVFRHGEGS